MKVFSTILLISILFSACGVNRYPVAPATTSYETPPTDGFITQSLFEDKTASISEANIQKILDGTYELPPQMRLAIIKLDGQRSYFWNDEEYLKNQQSYIDLLIEGTKKSGSVIKISLIPDLLLLKTPTFTNLREAAVRLQADAILIFSTTSDVYRKYKLFSKTDIKAFATTQLLVMDVRTGLIPFSTIVTKDYVSQKQEGELDLSETQRRIQNEAVLLTLNEIIPKLNDFLQKK